MRRIQVMPSGADSEHIAMDDLLYFDLQSTLFPRSLLGVDQDGRSDVRPNGRVQTKREIRAAEATEDACR